jgi:hypothetical protein
MPIELIQSSDGTWYARPSSPTPQDAQWFNQARENGTRASAPVLDNTEMVWYEIQDLDAFKTHFPDYFHFDYYRKNTVSFKI